MGLGRNCLHSQRQSSKVLSSEQVSVVGRAVSGVWSFCTERRALSSHGSHGGESLSGWEDLDTEWSKRKTSDHFTGKKIEAQNYHKIFRMTYMLITGRTLIEPKFLRSLLLAPFCSGSFWLSVFGFGQLLPWRRQWHPTPVLLPGESHGRRSLVGCCLWGRTESDTTEAT